LLYDVKRTLQQSSSFNSRIELTGKWNSILKAVHHETGVRVQFYCGEGPPPSVEYVCDYHAEYPAIRPLYMVTRLILEARDLFGSHRSSIEPNTLVMLLVAFLKMNHGRFQDSKSLGEQFLAVLKSFGCEVDLTTTGVSVDPPSFFNAQTVKTAIKKYNLEDLPAHLRGQRALVNLKRTAAAKRNIPAASRLCLQDPANYMNDLGRTCSRTRELQGAFAQAYDCLNICLGAWERPNRDQLNNSLLASILQANFENFTEVRAQITWARASS
jgi:DNA polymerase sigma